MLVVPTPVPLTRHRNSTPHPLARTMKHYCRIYGIMAREAPVCVLFRRGPSKWTQLVKWHTASDTFDAGQWFKGRIYEHRSDLTPNGRFLVYFASKINAHTVQDSGGYTYAWTAISEPPQFKAIALWPKGDCWHGGGLFASNGAVWLNHRPDTAQPHPNHNSSMFKVTPNPQAAGEDEPIHSMRLERDGWHCVQQGKFTMQGRSGWKTEQTEIWEKEGRVGKRLRRELLKIDFKSYGGPYIEQFSLVKKNDAPVTIADASWAELDQRGALVFARFGKLFRGALTKQGIEEKELTDLNKNQPPQGTANNVMDGDEE